MDDIVAYMNQQRWKEDYKGERKRHLIHLARQSKESEDIATKIGGMLIYNQVLEQFLVDIVDMSILYIKAEIWPEAISLDVELDKATFGQTIGYFKQFATIEPNRELILSHLKKYNHKRNQVVHDLFDIPDLNNLADELNEYAVLADELVSLLTEYDAAICDNFQQLSQRVVFQNE